MAASPPGLEDLTLHDLYVRQLWNSRPRPTSRRCRRPVIGSPTRGTWLIDVFDRAIAAFAAACSDQNERDHAALPLGIVAAGRIQARRDI